MSKLTYKEKFHGRIMTKAEAVRDFKRYIMPGIHKIELDAETHGRPDIPFRRQEWCNFVDGLCRDRRITEHQAQNWDNLFN